MATPADEQTKQNEETLRNYLLFIAGSIVRAEGAHKRREVKMRRFYIGVSIAFTLLGTAGVIRTKVEQLPAETMSWSFVAAIVSLIVLFVLELYRAAGVEETALKALAATKAFSLLELRTRHALRKANPLDEVAKWLKHSEDLEEMFDEILPKSKIGSVDYQAQQSAANALATSWLDQQRIEGGLRMPTSQQKPKKPGGGK